MEDHWSTGIVPLVVVVVVVGVVVGGVGATQLFAASL